MKSREIDYWDALWWQGPDLGIQWKHRAAAALVEHQPVLDIGCGTGHFLDALRQRGLEKLVGCDLALSSAKSLSARGLPALCCDAERPLPFPDGQFATVALIDVLEHTFEPERILGRGGARGQGDRISRSQLQLGDRTVPSSHWSGAREQYAAQAACVIGSTTSV